MKTLYEILTHDAKSIDSKIEEHKAVVKSKSLCRVMDFYNFLTLLKYPASIIGIVFISDGWLKKMGEAKSEGDKELPCTMSGISYKCFMSNYEEIEFYYKFMANKAIVWLILYIICAVSHNGIVLAAEKKQKVLRSLKIAMLKDQYFEVEQGDHMLLNLLSQTHGIGAVICILAKLNKKMEKNCKPSFISWPNCVQEGNHSKFITIFPKYQT